MGRKLDIITFTFLFVAVFMYSRYNYAVMHEQVHASVCTYYGGEPNVTVRLGGSGVTYCDGVARSPEEMADFAYLNSMNEVVGYPLAVLNTTMLFCTFLIGFAVLISKEDSY